MRINLKENHASKLRRALLGNALFSGFSGTLIVLAKSEIDRVIACRIHQVA